MDLAHSKRKGNVGELAASLECAKKGYSVFKELGDISKTDLVIEVGCDLFKIQVKYVEKNKFGTYIISNKKNGPNGYCYTYGRNEIDIFGVYCCNDDVLIWVPVNSFIVTDNGEKFAPGEKSKSNSLTFRTPGDLPKNNQVKKVNYLDEYTSLNRAIKEVKDFKKTLAKQ